MAVLKNLDYVSASVSSSALTDSGVTYALHKQGAGYNPALLTDPNAIGLPSLRDRVYAQTPAGGTADRCERDVHNPNMNQLYYFGGTRYIPYHPDSYPFPPTGWCSLIQIWQLTDPLSSPPVMVGLRTVGSQKILELRAGNDATMAATGGNARVWSAPMDLAGDESLLNHPWDFVLGFKFDPQGTGNQLRLMVKPWGGTLLDTGLLTDPLGYVATADPSNLLKLKTGIYRGPQTALTTQPAWGWWVDSARDKLGDWYNDVKPW